MFVQSGADAGVHPAGSPRHGSADRRPGRRAYGLVAFVALALIEAAWVFGLPLGGSPDEPAHVYRAVALDRYGDLIPATAAKGSSLYLDPPYYVKVPTATVNAVAPVMCTAWRSNVGNACAKKYVPGTDEPVTQVTTAAGRYLWVYYAVVGIPSLLDPGRHGVFGMRLVGAWTSAALLAAAASTMLRLRRPVLPAVGVAAALTPMVTGMAATVNPNAWEICGGVLVWASLLALVGGEQHRT